MPDAAAADPAAEAPLPLDAAARDALVAAADRGLPGTDVTAATLDGVLAALDPAELAEMAADLRDTPHREECLLAEALLCLLRPVPAHLAAAFASAAAVGETGLALALGGVLADAGKLDADAYLTWAGLRADAGDAGGLDSLLARGALPPTEAGQYLLTRHLIATGHAAAGDCLRALFAVEVAKFPRRIAPLIEAHLAAGGFRDEAELWRAPFRAGDARRRKLIAGALIRTGRLGLLSGDELARLTKEPLDARCWAAQHAYEATGETAHIRSALNAFFLDAALSPVEIAPDPEAPFFERLSCPARPGPLPAPQTPRVSVILCAHDANATLGFAYRSIAAQTYPEIEIVVVDDAGSQRAADALDPVPGRAPVLVRNDTNLGPYGARNAGLARASGDFIAFHDADDWAHPEKIARQVARLSETGAMAHFGRHVRLDPAGNLRLENNLSFLGDGPMTGLFRHTAFAELGHFLPVRSRGDMEFKWRLAAAYGDAAILEEPVLCLLAMDWHSNSKRALESPAQLVQLMHFHERGRAVHRMLPFLRGRPEIAETLKHLVFGPMAPG